MLNALLRKSSDECLTTLSVSFLETLPSSPTAPLAMDESTQPAFSSSSSLGDLPSAPTLSQSTDIYKELIWSELLKCIEEMRVILLQQIALWEFNTQRAVVRDINKLLGCIDELKMHGAARCFVGFGSCVQYAIADFMNHKFVKKCFKTPNAFKHDGEMLEKQKMRMKEYISHHVEFVKKTREMLRIHEQSMSSCTLKE